MNIEKSAQAFIVAMALFAAVLSTPLQAAEPAPAVAKVEGGQVIVLGETIVTPGDNRGGRERRR